MMIHNNMFSGSLGGSVASGSGTSGGAALGGKISKDVLRNLQDVVWSDDEEDPECPLCMEEMDPSDVNFKPCVCGYQICRFCHHQIIHDLNGLCPACRRSYAEQKIEFKPVDPEEMKKLQQSKLLKSKINKQLETLGRRHLRDVRIVIKNMVYVVGMKMPPGSGSGEEFLQVLRSNDYFGQYGKIAKLFLRKTPSSDSNGVPNGSSSSSSSDTDLGIYITYLRREDAARAIAALDGYQAPNNPGKVLKATYGTTKYCLYFLRGMKCEDGGGLGGGSCLGLHEWAGEGDVFTRKDMTTLQHTLKHSEAGMDLHHGRASASASDVTSIVSKPRSSEEMADAPALPRSASWATATRAPTTPQPLIQPARRGKAKVLSLTNPARPTISPHPSTSRDSSKAKAAAAAATPSTAGPASISSRPSTANGDATTPATGMTAVSMALTRSRSGESPKKTPAAVAAKASTSALSRTTSATESVSSSQPPPPPGIPPPPPGLASNPVSRRQSTTSRSGVSSTDVSEAQRPRINDSPEAMGGAEMVTPTAAESASSQQEQQTNVSPAPSSSPSLSQSVSPASLPANPQEQTGYQPSIQAQALMDDVMIRRQGQINHYTVQSPYPDFDNLMDCFADGDFTYRLDTKMAIDIAGDDLLLATTTVEDLGRKVEVGVDYDGAFNPFTETSSAGDVNGKDAIAHSSEDAQRKVSRFGFAQRSSDQPDPRGGGFTSASNMLSALLSKANLGTSQPSQFTGSYSEQDHLRFGGQVPGGMVQRPDSRADGSSSLTPSSKSALPFAFNPPLNRSTNSTQLPPPPPGLGPSNHIAFQQANLRGILNNRQAVGTDHAAAQALQSALNTFQQQFQQADVRRAASPGSAGVRSGNGVGRRDGFPGGEFSFQDPAIMAMRMGSSFSNPNPTPLSNGMFETSSPSHVSNTTVAAKTNPYPQQAFQSSSEANGMLPNARMLQQFHLAQQQQQQQQRTPSPADAVAAYGPNSFRPF